MLVPSLGVQILSISCSFWQNLAKSYVGAPRGVGTPSSGKSWIRHCCTTHHSQLFFHHFSAILSVTAMSRLRSRSTSRLMSRLRSRSTSQLMSRSKSRLRSRLASRSRSRSTSRLGSWSYRRHD